MTGPRSGAAADRAVEDVVRTSYGRLVGLLAVHTRDVAAAEDALADALEAALRTWPQRGVPDVPEAWMLTAARRSLIGAHRRSETARRAAPALGLLAEELGSRPASPFPDRRLELMFACAHPAIDPAVRAPLMVQVVLGLDVARMAPVFLVRPATLGQQLVRAKRRIAATGIPYRVPPASELPERLGFVLDAIYATYGTAWEDPAGRDPGRTGLADEALHLACAVATLLPDEAEAHGLAALVLHCEARSAARRDAEGRFVPLGDQDPTQWSPALMARAEDHLTRALALGSIGPYQLQAAIQSVHNRRAMTGRTDWPAVAALHDGLQHIAPTTGGAVARASAHLFAHGVDPAAGILADLADRAPASVEGYQPYWVVRAEVDHARGRHESATEAMSRAIELTTDADTAAHLRSTLVRRTAASGQPSAHAEHVAHSSGAA